MTYALIIMAAISANQYRVAIPLIDVSYERCVRAAYEAYELAGGDGMTPIRARCVPLVVKGRAGS